MQLQSTTGACDNIGQSRLIIHDPATNYKFLIDTGADVSVLPCSPRQNLKPSLRSNLYAANGSRISTFGTEICKPSFGLRRNFPWRFLLADVTSPILGADFLKHYDMMVDLRGECLIDKTTNMRARGHLNSIVDGLFGLKTFHCSNDYSGLLSQYSDVTRPRLPYQEVRHNVKHVIQINGPPCHSKFRRLPPHKLGALRRELKLFMELGYIRPSKSPYSSPVHLATKIS